MEKKIEKNRISFAMDALNLSAAALSRESGVDASIINKWRKGSRGLTGRSKAVLAVSAALVRLDGGGLLREYYAPYANGEGNGQKRDATAMAGWLCGKALPGMAGRTAPVVAPTSGEYTVEHVVYLGQRGFRKAAMAMLDYVRLLPPGQTITVLCQGRWEWLIRNIPFVVQFLAKLKKAVERGTKLRVVNRKGFSIVDSASFAGIWLTAHMKGHIRSLYYEGELPREIRFVGSIPGYWSARVEEDATVEDGLYVGLYTDPRETRRDAAICEEYAAKALPASQYAFFTHPEGSGENRRLWRPGPLPPWDKPGAQLPDGSFHALCRVPGIALATQSEARAVALSGGGGMGQNGIPVLPEYLLQQDGAGFAPGPHKVILCREDVQGGLAKGRRMHEVMGAILHRRAFVPREMLAAQLRRLLAAMEQRADFEVALMPRSAFQKLELEMVCFKDSVTIAWLQDMRESAFCNDEATAGSLYAYIDVVWGKLQKGWKRKKTVAATLRKWLAGQGLDEKEQDSATVRNWDMLPRE